jgi:hypothetical protein
VPGPQRAECLVADLRGLVVESVAEQAVGAPRCDRRDGAARRTDAHEDLERAHPDVLLARAQRGLGELELGGGPTGCGRAREGVEREAADLGIGIVEQPPQAACEPVVGRPGGEREDQVRGGAAAERRIGLAGQLQHGADRARIAEREQASRAADRGVGAAARELCEQRLELIVVERLAAIGG